MDVKISAVIITVPQHEQFLSGLIENLNLATPAFHQVVLVASGFGARRHGVITECKKIDSKETIVHFSPLGSAGANRNAGWKFVESEFVCFLDADDLYAPERNLAIQALHHAYGFDLFLHAFTSFDSNSQDNVILDGAEDFDLSQIATGKDLVSRERRDRNAELRGKTESTNILFADPRRAFPVHHAHLVVKNALRSEFQFHEVFGVRNEDGVFAQDVLDAGLQVVLSSVVLSGYRQGARAKPKRVAGVSKILNRTAFFFLNLFRTSTFIVSAGKVKRFTTKPQAAGQGST
jgi:glycosyltransferase involved in cell wall biosynthesis